MEYTYSVIHYLLLWYLIPQCNGNESQKTSSVYTAYVNITYTDPVTGDLKSEKEESGRFGSSSRIDTEQGWVVLVRTKDNKTHGCSPPVNVPSTRWIALVERGSCKFHEKISNAAIKKNASAVVIYNNEQKDDLLIMHHEVNDVVSIFLSKEDGMHIVDLLENGTKVWMQITVGRQQIGAGHHNINKTSVLFVSISFIVLMIISLAWLVFYYIQRFRYAHAKERLSKRLMHAARKAITRMPMRTLKNGDKETDSECDPCAVCIENYRAGDIVRVLPCKHLFHKSCIDPWLIEQRNCPMCKLDILKAFGLQVHASRESLINMELEAASTSIGPSELMPTTGGLRDDHHIVELVYYPYSVHLRPRLPETRSEAEETITGLEPAIASLGPSEVAAVMEYDYHNCSNESEALIPKNHDDCDGGNNDKRNTTSVGSLSKTNSNKDNSELVKQKQTGDIMNEAEFNSAKEHFLFCDNINSIKSDDEESLILEDNIGSDIVSSNKANGTDAITTGGSDKVLVSNNKNCADNHDTSFTSEDIIDSDSSGRLNSEAKNNSYDNDSNNKPDLQVFLNTNGDNNVEQTDHAECSSTVPDSFSGNESQC